MANTAGMGEDGGAMSSGLHHAVFHTWTREENEWLEQCGAFTRTGRRAHGYFKELLVRFLEEAQRRGWFCDGVTVMRLQHHVRKMEGMIAAVRRAQAVGGAQAEAQGEAEAQEEAEAQGGAEAQGEAQAEAGSALSLQSAVSNLTERALDNVTEELKKKLTPALLARLGGKLLCGGKGSLGGGSGAVASRHERSVVNIDAQRRALCYDVMLPPAVRLALQNNVVVKRMVDNVGSVTGEDLVSWCKYLREEYGKKLNMEKLKTVNLWRVILIDRLLLQMLAEGVIVGVNELEGERAGEVTRMLRPGRMWEVAYNRCVEFNAAFRLLQREMFEGKARYAHTVTPCKEVLDALGMGPPPTAPKEASKWRGPSESDPAMHCNEAGEWRIMPQLRDGLYYTRFEYREEKFEANANILFDDAPHRMKRQRELSGVLGGERGGQKRPRVSPGAPAGVSGGPPAYALERLAAVCAGEMRGGAGA